MPLHPLVRLARRTGLALAMLLAAACGDAGGPVGPPAAAPLPGDALQVVSCQVEVRAGTVLCRPYEGESGGGASTARILGAQGVNVRVTSSNVQYDSATQVFGMDVAVQNLLAQRMGTADGASVTGVTVFFHSEPGVVGSSGGAVSVRNADGEGFFTGGGQSYFHYPEVLPLNAVSAARRWEFDCSRAVERFTFLVYVRAELLPVVVFDRAVDGNRDVWRVALDGGDLVRLTTHIGDDRNPTAAGGRVVFVTYRHGYADLYAVPLAGGAETRLTATSTVTENDPALSYDGRRLAFTSDASGGVSKVWMANADATGAVRATPSTFGSNSSPEASPSWGPLNDRLALVATSSGTADVVDFPLGSVPVALAAGPNAEVNPAWSPDGRFVVYASNVTGAGDLYLVRVQTGEVTRLTTATEAELNPSWTLDGRIVYMRSLPGGAKEIRWLDPAVPGSVGTVPLGAGGAPERAHVVAF